MTLSFPSSVTLISQIVFRRHGKEVMIFKINIEVNLKDINKPYHSWEGRGNTDKIKVHIPTCSFNIKEFSGKITSDFFCVSSSPCLCVYTYSHTYIYVTETTDALP